MKTASILKVCPASQTNAYRPVSGVCTHTRRELDNREPARCMNRLLFERSSGRLGPDGFIRLQTARLLSSFGAAPQLCFDGGDRGSSTDIGDGSSAAGLDPSLGNWYVLV